LALREFTDVLTNWYVRRSRDRFWAGVTDDQYGPELEADASCRAVYVYGIPASDYVDTSSPCDVDGWYDGWLLDHLASLGVQVTEPMAADYEVLEAVRP